MIPLDRAALASPPLTAAEVEAIYESMRAVPPAAGRTHFETLVARFAGCVRRLCASHERLRRELVGAEELLTDGDRTRGELLAACEAARHELMMAGYRGGIMDRIDAAIAKARGAA